MYRVELASGSEEVVVDDWLRQRAEQRIKDWPLGHDVTKAFRAVEGREVGAMGELVALRYLSRMPWEVWDVGTINHDLLVDSLRVEVKTKERTVPPRPNFDCSVAAYLHGKQAPDRYLFVSLLGNPARSGVARFTRAWVLGTIEGDRFWQSAERWVKGQHEASNTWTCSEDCYSVKASALDSPKRLVGVEQ